MKETILCMMIFLFSSCAITINAQKRESSTFNNQKRVDSTCVAKKRFDGDAINKIIVPIFKRNGCKERKVHYRHENVDTTDSNIGNMPYGFAAGYMECTPDNYGESYGTHYIAPDNETGKVIFEQLNIAIADYCKAHPNEQFLFKPGRSGISTFILEGNDPTYKGESRNRPKFNILVDHVNNRLIDFLVLNTVGELWIPADVNVVKDMNDYNFEYYKMDCDTNIKYYYEQQEIQGKIKTKRL